MRHFKRFAVALLVVAMILSSAGFAGATAPDVDGTRYEESVDYLMGLGVIAGYPDGTYKPEATITRAEAAKILVVMKYGDTTLADLLKGASPFVDVPGDHWASGFIALAKNANIVNGYPDGTFKPSNPVTYAEFAKMLCEAAGLTPVAGLAWPANYVSAALNAGILTDVPNFESNAPATRGDCAIMAAFTVAEVANPTTGKTLAQSVFGETAVATVEVTPATATAGEGKGVTFAAVAKDADGNIITDATITWSTSDPTKSAITNDGYFVAAAGGSGDYTVTATADGVAGTALVEVYGDADALVVTADKTTVPANGVTKITVTVKVVDKNGNVVADDDDTEIELGYAEDGDNGAVELDDVVETAENGVAEFEVVVTENADVTDILEATADDLDEGTVEISTVEQVATAIELEADADELMVNSQDWTVLTATVVDQAGKQMVSGQYDITFAISGPGFLDEDDETDDVTQTTIAQETDIVVWSEQGEPGAITVTASADGLEGASLTLNSYLAGDPRGLAVTVEEGAGEAGGEDNDGTEDDLEVIVTLVDKNGHPTIPEDGDTYEVEFEWDDDDATFAWQADTDWTFHAGETRLTFTGYGETAGTWAITVNEVDGNLTGTAFEVSVVPGPAVEVLLTPDLEDGDLLVHISKPTVTFTAKVIDAYENAVPKAGIDLKFSADGLSADIHDYSFDDATVETDATGQATVVFTCDGYVGDAWQVIVEADLDDDGVFEATAATDNDVVVSDTVPKSLTIVVQDAYDGDNIASLVADEDNWAFVTIQLKDTNGNDMDTSGLIVKVEFTNDGDNIQSITDDGDNNDMFVDGDWEGVAEFLTVDGKVDFSFEGGRAGSFRITATAVQTAAGASGSKTFRTKLGTEAVGVAVFLTDGSLADEVDYDGDEVIQVRLCPVDYGNNVIEAPDDMDITLDAIEATAEYRTKANGTAIGPDYVIDEGDTTVTLYYVDSEDGDDVDLTDDWVWIP